MSRRGKPLPLLENIPITDLAAEGKALARWEGMAVFVPWCVPGDVCDLQITRKKHSFAEAEVVRFRQKSPNRVEPFCPHFGVCGGCKWQMLPYAEQLRFKQQQVLDQLTRIGKLTLPPVSPILPSKHTQAYRNKLEFAFSPKRWLTRAQIQSGEEISEKRGLGFHIPGCFDKILDIEECHLMPEVNNRVRLALRAYAIAHDLTFYDARSQQGLLRGMMLRTSSAGETMLLLQFQILTPDDERQAMQMLSFVKEELSEVTSLFYVNNTKCNDTFSDLPLTLYHGTPYLVEHMEDLRFKVGPKSFYQTNTEQAYELYKVVRHFASLTGEELVYDLYTGTGTIANFLARSARRVIGIEYVADAIDDAKENSRLNQLDNTLFFAGDMKDVLTPDFLQEHGRPDVIITDPPRAGMHPDVVKVILQARPARIVYVSCNPATQARDLSLLCPAGYQIEQVQPVDMFPHTQHVENVVLLQRSEE